MRNMFASDGILWSEDGCLKDAETIEYMKWFPAFNAYFIERFAKRTAQMMSTLELTNAINDGLDLGGGDVEVMSNGNGYHVVQNVVPLPPSELKADALPTGMFRLIVSNTYGVGLEPYKPCFDDYVDLQTHTQTIQNDIEMFLAKEPEYRKIGLLYRRGILLYGPQGTGKSFLVEVLCSKYRDQVRVLLVPPGFSVRHLNELRGLLKDRVTFFIFEELANMVTSDTEISAMLNFLDGTNSWDKSLVIATTNHPENLPANIVDRPSRFDRLYKIDNPSESVRKIYLVAKLGAENVTDELVRSTKGYSVAHLRDLVVSIPIYGIDPHERLRQIEEVKRLVKKEFANSTEAMGFKKDD